MTTCVHPRSRAAVLAAAIVGGSLLWAPVPAVAQACIDHWDDLLVKTSCDDWWECVMDDGTPCDIIDWSYTLTGFAADPLVTFWSDSGVHTTDPITEHPAANGVAPFTIHTLSLRDLGTYTYWFDGESVDAEGNVEPMTSEADDWTIVNAPPTANPTVTGTMKVGNTLQFQSAGSDPDHGSSGLHYEWSVTASPSGAMADFSSSSSASPTMSLADKHDIGEWSVTVGVGDLEGELKEYDLDFEVVNQPPTLEFDGEGEVDAGDPIDLIATPDLDADGETITWVWDIDAVPMGASLQPQDGFSTNQQLLIPTGPQDIGIWQFTCTAKDEHDVTVTEHTSVEVIAVPPEINIEGDDDIDVGTPIQLETTILTDAYGDPLASFEWELVQVPVSAGVPLGVIGSDSSLYVPTGAAHAGTWRFKLTVTDQVNQTASANVSVLVDAQPTASISGPDTVASLSTSIELDGSGSVDPDSPDTPDQGHISSDGSIQVSAGITVYEWSVLAVPPELYGADYHPGPVVDVFGLDGSYDKLEFPAGKLPVGEWFFELKVKDGEGNSASAQHWVKVLDESMAPTVILSPPKTYTTDLSGVLSENVVVDGSLSMDPDNTLNEPEAPGLGITDYAWSLVTTPPTCTSPPSPPSGLPATTFTLAAAGSAIPASCQGVYTVGLTVTDDDAPTPKQGTDTTIVRIGNCAGDICIDYPTKDARQDVTFSDQTDIIIYYHLNSILYDDAAFAAGLRLRLKVFHEDDLVNPAFDKAWDVDLLPSDKGGALAVHWSGFDNNKQRPKPGKYTINLQVVDAADNPTGYEATEADAIWIQVIDVAVASTSDRYLDRDALAAGTDTLNVNYTIVGQGLTAVDQLVYRVRDAPTNAQMFEGSEPPPFTGAFAWTTKTGSTTFLPAGDYKLELELRAQGAALGTSPAYDFTVYEVKVKNPIDADGNGSIDDAEEDAAGNGSEFTFWDPANRFHGSAVQNAAQLRIDCSATVTPAALGTQLRWRVFNGDDVSATGVAYAPAGTASKWDGAAVAEGSGTAPRFTIDGMPALNDDFGGKTVRVQLLDPTDASKVLKQIAVPIEVFWPLLIDPAGSRTDANFAKSHNSADLNATNATDLAGTATRDATRAPNWMVFWGPVVETNDGMPAANLRYGDTLVGNTTFGATPAILFFDDGYTGRHDRVLIAEAAQGDDSDPDGIGPREETDGIDAFRDTVVHESHHAIDESVGFTNSAFGLAIDGATPVADAHWSFRFDKPAALPVPPLLGRAYNHYIDLNGDGDFADPGEDLDTDGDDMPDAIDPDPTVPFNGDVGNLALDSEPDKNHVLASKDWGNPGKRHKTDDNPNN